VPPRFVSIGMYVDRLSFVLHDGVMDGLVVTETYGRRRDGMWWVGFDIDRSITIDRIRVRSISLTSMVEANDSDRCQSNPHRNGIEERWLLGAVAIALVIASAQVDGLVDGLGVVAGNAGRCSGRGFGWLVGAGCCSGAQSPMVVVVLL
jgi:hypothetical protein